MTATLAQIRADMGALLGGISGLTVDDKPRDRVEPPNAVIGLPESVDFQLAFGKAKAGYIIPVRLYVARYDATEAVKALDAYLLPTGALSVKAALDGPGSTSGWDFCNVTMASGFGVYTVGDIDYIGCEFTVEIKAT